MHDGRTPSSECAVGITGKQRHNLAYQILAVVFHIAASNCQVAGERTEAYLHSSGFYTCLLCSPRACHCVGDISVARTLRCSVVGTFVGYLNF